MLASPQVAGGHRLGAQAVGAGQPLLLRLPHIEITGTAASQLTCFPVAGKGGLHVLLHSPALLLHFPQELAGRGDPETSGSGVQLSGLREILGSAVPLGAVVGQKIAAHPVCQIAAGLEKFIGPGNIPGHRLSLAVKKAGSHAAMQP